jgi:hypothetical protein
MYAGLNWRCRGSASYGARYSPCLMNSSSRRYSSACAGRRRVSGGWRRLRGAPGLAFLWFGGAHLAGQQPAQALRVARAPVDALARQPVRAQRLGAGQRRRGDRLRREEGAAPDGVGPVRQRLRVLDYRRDVGRRGGGEQLRQAGGQLQRRPALRRRRRRGRGRGHGGRRQRRRRGAARGAAQRARAAGRGGRAGAQQRRHRVSAVGGWCRRGVAPRATTWAAGGASRGVGWPIGSEQRRRATSRAAGRRLRLSRPRYAFFLTSWRRLRRCCCSRAPAPRRQQFSLRRNSTTVRRCRNQLPGAARCFAAAGRAAARRGAPPRPLTAPASAPRVHARRIGARAARGARSTELPCSSPADPRRRARAPPPQPSGRRSG